VKTKGDDSQVSVMMGHVGNEKKPEAPFSEPKESGAEPFSQRDVALARFSCPRGTCGLHDDDLRREEDDG